MNIKSITFESKGKQFNLKREMLVPSNRLVLSDTRNGAQEHHWDTIGRYIVTNESATAAIIFCAVEGYVGTAGDTADICNMVALLTQG